MAAASIPFVTPPAPPPAIAPAPALARRVAILLYALMLIALSGLAYGTGNPAILVVGIIAAVASWILVERTPPHPLPRILINGAVLLAAVNFFYQAFSDDPENILQNLGYFMAFILISKMFEQKRPRDIAQILGLSLLVVVTSSIFAITAGFGLIIALFAGLALYTLVLFHVRAESAAALATQRLTFSAAQMLTARAALRDFRRTAAACGIILFTIAAFIFLVTPRTTGTPFNSPWSSPSFETGYSSTVRLYPDQQLIESDAVVMQVKLEQGDVNIGSEIYQPYFRGLTFDSYQPDRHQWLRSMNYDSHPARWLGDHWFELDGTARPDLSKDITQTYSMQLARNNVMFTVDDPLVFHSEQIGNVGFTSTDYSTIIGNTPRLPLQYSVISRSNPPRTKAPTTMPAGILGTYQPNFNAPVTVPVPPDVTETARTVARDLLPQNNIVTPAIVRAVADRFEHYLTTTYPYTLSFQAVDRTLDPTADFLKNRKTIGGHCEVFASAMVMMCRAVGINARMVTGFHGGDWNSLGGFYIVRQLHAHAWTEVYLPDEGWTLYDPSPVGSDRAPTSDGFARWLREMTQVVQQSWLSNIVSFDTASQASIVGFLRGLGAQIADALRFTWGGLVATFTELAVGSPDATPLHRLLGWIILVTGSVLTAVLIRGIWRRRTNPLRAFLWRQGSRVERRRLTRELGFFGEFLRILQRRGVRRRDHQTPREFVESVRPAFAGAEADADTLLQAFYDLRLGGVKMTDELASRLDAALQRLRRNVRENRTVKL